MIKLGAQLFTIRNYIQTPKDFARSMEKIAAIGYDCVQISAVPSYDAKEYRNICDAYGLEIGLTHGNPDRIMNQTEQVIEDHQILGCPYIGIGCMPDRYRDPQWTAYFAEDFTEAAEKIKAAGMKLMYHNHGFEFQHHLNGRDLLECMTDAMPADILGITLDVFWVQAGGKNVMNVMAQYNDRLDCIHLKDMKSKGKELIFAEIGEGFMDNRAIIDAAEGYGTKYMFVEQDECYDRFPFESMKISYDNIAQKIMK